MAQKPINRLNYVDSVTPEEKSRHAVLSQAVEKTIIATQGIILIMSMFLSLSIMKISSNIPNVNFIKNIDPEQSTQIYDINDELIAEINADEDRVYVPIEKISPFFIRAVVAIEDIRFYNHKGVDLKGTIRAFLNNLTGASSLQGGSTITQQLAKNWYLIPEKSFKRKFLEAMLAARIENILTKDQILEKYMNLIYLGNRSYGIERAAKRYFGKKAEELNLRESSLLAALIKAPELYSPYSNYEEATKRQKIVLKRMLEHGFISKKQYDNALKKEIKLKSPGITLTKYPYFVDHVLYLLRQRYGEKLVKKGGLKIYTTLDPVAQEIAKKTIEQGVRELPKYTNVREGALVTIEVETGYIKAIIGGVDYSDSQFNRATLSKRATGSGFKPIIYLTGFRLGIITPSSYVMDAPIAYRTKWNVWCPHNWDGRYMGRLTVRKALTLSRNTPTVRIALEAGLDKVIETARLLGIRSHMNRGYSIVLGSAGLAPIEVATMYSTLARDGVYLEPTAIRRVIDSKGNLLESNKRQPVRVVSSKFVRQLNSILIDVVEKGTGRQAKLEGCVVAGKTGTTDDFKDVWFNGFTPDTVTTIWLGNDENQSLNGIWSSNCAKLWKNFSKEYYAKKDITPDPFELPNEDTEKTKKEKEEGFYDRPVVTPPRNYNPENNLRRGTIPQNQNPQRYYYRSTPQSQQYPHQSYYNRHYYQTHPPQVRQAPQAPQTIQPNQTQQPAQNPQPAPTPQPPKTVQPSPRTYQNYNQYRYQPRPAYPQQRPAVRPPVYRYNR